MGTGNTFKSDLYSIFNVYQNTLVAHPKELFIETLRDYFSQDSYYHFVKDAWGYPKTPDHSDLDSDAGISDDATTRIFIGENFRYDVRYYPSILVKSLGSKYVPISMSRNKGVVQWENVLYVDGYGSETIIATPSYYVQSGAWEGSISLDIETKSPRSRDEIIDLISILFTEIRHDDMKSAGVYIKGGANVGSTSEIDDRNDKIYRQSVTFEIRTEWERRTYITDVIDAINICVDLGNLEPTPPDFGPNIQINTNVEFVNAIVDL
jgi:hypothetical protein